MEHNFCYQCASFLELYIENLCKYDDLDCPDGYSFTGMGICALEGQMDPQTALWHTAECCPHFQPRPRCPTEPPVPFDLTAQCCDWGF